MPFDSAAQVISALIGLCIGVGVIGTADNFTYSRKLWPVPICPHCGHRSTPMLYVPVLGPLLVRGRCATCNEVSSWHTAVVVQLVTAVLAVLLFRRYGMSSLLISAGVETAVLTAIAVIDYQHRLIPTLLVYPTILFALAFSPTWPNLGIWNSLLGGALAFALFFSLAFLARVAFGEGALGDGDVTLAALIGAICGYPMVVLSLALGALCGGIGATLLLLLRRSPLGTTIPYGPYLVAGVIYVLLTGNTTQPMYGIL